MYLNETITLPVVLSDALARNEKARLAFARLAPSHREEFLRWILEAKKTETQRNRVVKTIDMLLAND